jgi:ferric-dicitrate binding protein FerR (iron transport regulator)
MIKLPDGSIAYLNRNTTLTYNAKTLGPERKVKLSGEAFFEILPDHNKPFIIDAGGATIKVLGTSFNVVTRNNDSSVEVFVKTGKVMMSESPGTRSIVVDPGFVGKIDPAGAGKKLNDNPNYMAWNTRRLTYDGQKLGVVFRDIEKMYNITIIASDPVILDLPIATSFYNEPDETIIRIICTTFNLTYSKDGNIYHLGKK